ncbi:MAG: FlgK family flagellar hook-associated protein [Luminiphilus sp.]
MDSCSAEALESRGAPNDLLDRRDQAITDLSKLIRRAKQRRKITALINVMIGKGQRLVIGNSAEQLTNGLARRAGRTEQIVLVRAQWCRVGSDL